MTIPKQRATLSCPGCQIGHLRAQPVLYFNPRPPYPVEASQFPAWVCDLCGYRAYDPHTLTQVQAMLWMSPRTRPLIQFMKNGPNTTPPNQNTERRRQS